MTFARKLACLAVGAAVLAACSKPSGGGAASGPVPTGPSGNPVSASSDSRLPDIKPGLWEIHINHVSGAGVAHGGVTQQCMDPATMAEGRKTGEDYAKANCSKNVTTGGNGRWVSDLECKAAGAKMTTHSVTTMRGDETYHTELTTTSDPAGPDGATNTTTMVGKWIGPCKPT